MKRHSSRDKDKKGIDDHVATKRHAPSQETRIHNSKKGRGGKWCVAEYICRRADRPYVSYEAMSLQELATIRRGQNERMKGYGWLWAKNGSDLFAEDGVDYETAKEIARALKYAALQWMPYYLLPKADKNW